MRKPDFVVGPSGYPYLLRWWVIPRNQCFNIYLHRFMRSDDPRAPHDHPWHNVSILLKGEYLEHLPEGAVKLRKPWRPWAPWRVYARRATAAHRIELIVCGRPVWSLFFTGPVIRRWGFHCPKGWVFWKDFVSTTPGGNEIGKGCGE
jgi:hypothetical protein